MSNRLVSKESLLNRQVILITQMSIVCSHILINKRSIIIFNLIRSWIKRLMYTRPDQEVRNHDPKLYLEMTLQIKVIKYPIRKLKIS